MLGIIPATAFVFTWVRLDSSLAGKK